MGDPNIFCTTILYILDFSQAKCGVMAGAFRYQAAWSAWWRMMGTDGTEGAGV